MPINWVDVADPHNPPAGAPKLEAANLNKLAVVADVGTPGTATGDALKAAYVARSNLTVNVKDYGAKGDGSTDDTAALAAFLSSGATSGYLPPGTYLTTQTFVQPATMSIQFAPGAVVKATAAMTNLYELASVGTVARQQSLIDATFDCNNLATNGMLLWGFEHFELRSPSVINPLMHGIILGDPATPGPPFECLIRNASITRGTAAAPAAVPSGSIGLWVRRATDGEYNGAVIVGYDIGVRSDTDANRFLQMHPWGYPGNIPTTSFYDRAHRNLWFGCNADSPSANGWLMEGFYTTIIGGIVFANGNVPDDVLVGVNTTQSSPNFTAVGLKFQGANASHRIHVDFGGVGVLAGAVVIGCEAVFTTTVVANQVTYASARFTSSVNVVSAQTSALSVRDAASALTLDVNPQSKVTSFLNGGSALGYKDNYTTATWQLDASKGGIRSGTAAGRGVTRYSGSGAPAFAASLGDRYDRSDTPTVSLQREYICTTASSATTGAWTAIL